MNDTDRGTCFVMQPFDDGGPFDKRFVQVLKPAAAAAGLDARRADDEPNAEVVIEDIEERIRQAKACIADISTDNPNVAYELGYALAMKKKVVLIGRKGTELPFNFRHRRAIFYDTDAPGDFKEFGEKVTKALNNAIEKAEEREQIAVVLQPTAGLRTHEVAALAAIAQVIEHPGDKASVFAIRNAMEEMGYTKPATLLALHSLGARGMVRHEDDADHNGEPYTVYLLEEPGMDWLQSNHNQLELRTTNHKRRSAAASGEVDYGDIPF
jgi:nucleoside 2-deoxyribosyltransferase